MRRIIEELVEKRKQQQQKLKHTLSQLGQLIDNQRLFSRLFKKKNSDLGRKLLEVNDDLNNLVTIQDKEWDAYANNHSTMVFKSLQWKIEKLEAEYTHVKAILINFISLEQSLERLITSIDRKTGEITGKNGQDETGKPAIDLTLSRIKRAKEILSTYQYADFEQRFRGDDQSVKEKLKNYLPLFNPYARVLDIGCGRGEFMELLREQGKYVEGIDLSESMLQVAQEKGLNCQKGDALEFLTLQPQGEWDGIFSAQVIEHLEPGYLRELVLASFRVLSPQGLLLLETVNPLSLFALSQIYFLDVTHHKPLHPEYMRYLMESSGFSDVNIVYQGQLEEEQLEEISPEEPVARVFNSNIDKLNKLLYASPVYAVTGIKK